MKPKNTLSKVIWAVLLFTLLFYIIYGLLANEVKATYSSNRYTYNGSNLDTNAYPGFKEKLDILRKNHPNWTFTIMETGLDWSQVITAETAGHWGSPKNLIQSKSGAWICSTCGDTVYDNGTWKHASEMAIRYYMDPRNWLADNEYLFQFLQIDYLNTTNEQIYNSLANTFLHNLDYASQINQACKEININPYYVVARLLQEQGTKGGSTWKMESNGTTYYNLFNIGASGNSPTEIWNNALSTAMANGWTSVGASIKGGVSALGNYINDGQNTQYLNKFDVEPYDGTYWQQYMQNIEAPKNEASKLYNNMKEAGLLNQSLNFIIPVFENMPSTASQSPDGVGEIYPKNIRVKEGHSNVTLRSGATTSASVVYTIPDSSVVLLSVERLNNGWHKVVLTDGRWGYLKFDTSYLEEIDDLTNCYESKNINSDGVPMYVGPGASQTLLTTLSFGQSVTRIDNTGRYTFDGTTWDRIVLADGRQGFVERKYLSDADTSQILTVRADGGLFLRSTPAMDETNKIRLLSDGTQVTRIGTYIVNGVETKVDNHYWDYVITADGAKGYVARDYLRDSNGNVAGSYTESLQKTEIKDDEIFAIPVTTVDSIKNEIDNVTSIKDSNGNEMTSGLVGTGCKVTANGKEYTVVKMGDAQGDGNINSGDLLKIKKYLLGDSTLGGAYYEASDTNFDNNINSGDLLKIKKYLLGDGSLSTK